MGKIPVQPMRKVMCKGLEDPVNFLSLTRKLKEL